MSRKLKFLLMYGCFLAVLALVVLAVAEVAVRAFVPRHVWQLRSAIHDWQADPELGWVNIPNLDVTTPGHRQVMVRFHLNADGLQPASAVEAKAPGRPRVMLFGDSATVGRAVPENDRLAEQLVRAMESRGETIEVICAGVEGYSTDQVLLAMRRLLPRYRPDVAIYMVCDNDLGGNGTHTAYGLAKPRLTPATDGTLTLAPPAPEAMARTWGAIHKKSGVREHIQSSALYRVMYPALERVRFRSDWRAQSLAGGVTPEAQVALLGRADWELFGALLGEMPAACEQNGAAFFVTQHPHSWEVWDQRATPEQQLWLDKKLRAITEARQIGFCPTASVFLGIRSEGPFHLLPRDPHCNAKGYETTARILTGYLQAKGLAVKPGTALIPNPK